jgi:hypothetical protein
VAGDGTQFSIDIDVPADSAVAAAAVVDTLAARLKTASDAATAAADAVRSGEGAYKQAEMAADGAAKALERIGLQSDATRVKMQAAMQAGDDRTFWKLAGTLGKLEERQAEAAKKADEAKAALLAEATALDHLKTAAADATGQQEKLSKSLDGAKKAASAAESIESAAKGTGNLGKLSGALNQLGGPLGAVGGKATGAADAIADLTETVGAAGPYVALAVAVVALSTAMLAAGVAATKWALGMADAARGTKELEKREERLKKLTTSLFAGPKVQGAFDKFLGGLDSLVDLFDESNASGKAMRVVFDDLFGGLIDGAAGLLPAIRSAFIEFEILVLKALIAIKPFGSTILEVGKAILIAGAVIAGVLVAALGAAIILIVAFVAAVGKTIQTLWSLGEAVVKIFGGLDLAQIGTQLVQGLIAGILGMGPALLNAISGLAGSAVTAAKKALGIASPSKVFEAEVGGPIGEGAEKGIEAASGGVQSALESMVAPPAKSPLESMTSPAVAQAAAPTAGATAASAESGGSASGGANLAGATFNFYGVEGAEQAEGRFRELLVQLLEGNVAQLGLAVANAE